MDGPDGLCGGGAIETPGCADAHSRQPYNTGNAHGAGVSNVMIEDIAIVAASGAV